MRKLTSVSLELSIPLIVAIFSCILIATLLRLQYIGLYNDLLKYSENHIKKDMINLQRELESNFSSGNIEGARQAISFRGVDTNYHNLMIIDGDGKVLQAINFSFVGKNIEQLTQFSPEDYTAKDKPYKSYIRHNKDTEQLIARFHLILSPQGYQLRSLNQGVLFVIYDLKAEQEKMLNTLVKSSLPVIIIVVFSLLSLLLFLHYFVNYPIKHLLNTAKSLASGNSEARNDIHGSGEFAKLASAFDQMANELNHRFSEVLRAEKALFASQAQIVSLFENTDAISVFGIDKNRNVVYWNSASEIFYGFKKHELIGKPIVDFLVFDKHKKSFDDFCELSFFEKTSIPSLAQTFKKSDGSKINVLSSYVILQNLNDEPEIYGVSIDLTENIAIKELVSHKDTVLDTLFGALTDLLFLIERDGTIVDYRAGQNSETYVPPEAFLNKNLREVMPDDISNLFFETVNKMDSSTDVMSYEYSLAFNSKTKYYETRLSQLPESTQILAIVRDITERKLDEEKIRFQASFDSLTNLPNRSLALDRLSLMMSEAERRKELVVVAFLDLDDFKKVNDSLGHEVGDKLLIESARRLLGSIRKYDTVARLGGDEFIILITGVKAIFDVIPIIEKVLNEFRKPFKIDGKELLLSASIGISAYPNDADTPSKLLRNADSAMYSAKAHGRNTYSHFTKNMNQELTRRVAIEEQIHEALQRYEFSVHYQALISVASKKIIGAEALLRWNNPTLGNVSPEEFIPIAEQTGVIVALGQYVLNEALKVSSNILRKHSRKLKMAVNLSPRQFRDPELIKLISNALLIAKVDAENLELEITEGVLMTGGALIGDALKSLNALGIQIAMDDFGTGYSSLSYLRQYPFNILKIDRSFIADMTITPSGQELVNAAISMAHAIGLKVVAEGVETLEQFDILARLDCDVVQGYYFSKPIDEEQFEKLILSDTQFIT